MAVGWDVWKLDSILYTLDEEAPVYETMEEQLQAIEPLLKWLVSISFPKYIMLHHMHRHLQPRSRISQMLQKCLDFFYRQAKWLGIGLLCELCLCIFSRLKNGMQCKTISAKFPNNNTIPLPNADM